MPRAQLMRGNPPKVWAGPDLATTSMTIAAHPIEITRPIQKGIDDGRPDFLAAGFARVASAPCEDFVATGGSVRTEEEAEDDCC